MCAIKNYGAAVDEWVCPVASAFSFVFHRIVAGNV